MIAKLSRGCLTLMVACALLGCSALPQNPLASEIPGQRGATLNGMSQELTNLYGAKLQAKNTDDQLLQSVIESDLQTLATNATREAQTAQDDLVAVAFYRIAAVAAWQAGSTEVVSIGQAGEDKCRQLPNGLNSAPRDCAMLIVIPPLAANDELEPQLEALSKAGRQANPDQALALFNRFAALFQGLASNEPLIARSSAPESLQKVMRKQVGIVYCNATGARGVLVRAAGGNSPQARTTEPLRIEIEQQYTQLYGTPRC